MSLYTFNLKAGTPFHRAVIGKMILVDSTGAAEHITITPMRGSQEVAVLPERQKAFKCWIDYDNIILLAAVDCTVRLFLSVTDVSLGFADGALVNVRGGVSIENDPGNRVPVDIGGGQITVTADNVGINNGNGNPVLIQHQTLATLTHAAVGVNPGAAQPVVSNAALKRVVFRNASDTATIAIGAAGVTLATAAIVLGPGDTWKETDAPGTAWYATSDTAAASLRVMGMAP